MQGSFFLTALSCPCWFLPYKFFFLDRRIVHRDLKLQNLMLANKSDLSLVKIVDMGLAKQIMGVTNTSCGSPLFVAPEVGWRDPEFLHDWYRWCKLDKIWCKLAHCSMYRFLSELIRDTIYPWICGAQGWFCLYCWEGIILSMIIKSIKSSIILKLVATTSTIQSGVVSLTGMHSGCHKLVPWTVWVIASSDVVIKRLHSQ